MFVGVSRCFDSSLKGLIVTVASSEGLCFDSSPSAGERTALPYAFVAISRVEIQASWGSMGWPMRWLWASAKNGGRGASEGSAQIRSAHWSTQETQSMGTPQGAQASPCGGNLLIKPSWSMRYISNIWWKNFQDLLPPHKNVVTNKWNKF